MNTAVEMRDSWIRKVVCSEDGTGFILFHGYVYRSQGNLGVDAAESGWQNVRMTFRDMRVEGPPIPLDSYASEGCLTVDGAEDSFLISIGIERTGDVQLQMCLSDHFDTHFVRASAVTVELEGGFELESYWDAEGKVTKAR